MHWVAKLAVLAAGTVAALALWLVVVALGASEGWLRKPLAPRGDTDAFFAAAAQRIDAASEGNAALLLLDDGVIAGAHFDSVGAPVDGDTLFQVASLSKWITAWGVMALVEDGKLDVDAPVSRYLTRWSLPESPYENDGVTARRLLSHTAGLTDGLGYAGFAPGAPIDTLEQSLTRASDPSPGRDGVVRVGAQPGGQWMYSGGGYTLLQLLIEEISGEPFNDYMRRRVLSPLGMTRSTFVLDEGTQNVAEIFDRGGRPATHYTFTAVAAASLYTSANDLARFLQAHHAEPNAPAGRGVLSPATLEHMRRPHATQFGFPVWGLGVILFAPTDAGGFVIGHDGNNFPAINTAARVDPATGDGIVVLETGADLLASKLAGEWVFWNAGAVDILDIMSSVREAVLVAAVGAGAILLLAVLLGFVWLRRRPRAA